MKYAHIETKTNKLLGWYDDEIHATIPSPNIEVTEEVWQKALDINANAYENNNFIVKDFRTDEETLIENQELFRIERNKKLNEADILINKAEDNNEDTATLRAYRQALRDATREWVMPTLEEL